MSADACDFKSAKETARALGMHPSQISRLYSTGVIESEIHEGRMIRFDVAKVRKALAKRAREKQRQIMEHLPEGMVPTY